MLYHVRSNNRLISDGVGCTMSYGRAVQLFNQEVEDNPGNKVDLVTSETKSRVMKQHVPLDQVQSLVTRAEWEEWERGGGS